VTDQAGAWLAILVGATTLRLSLTDLYLRYVRATMRPWLVTAGLLLVAVGSHGLLRRRRGRQEAGAVDQGHGPGVATLLLLPVVAVLVVAPAPLGAYTAAHQGAAAASGSHPPVGLPAARDGAVDLKLGELGDRLAAGQDLSATRVRLVGFVAPDPSASGGFLLTRFQISCCAADARAYQVAIHDVTTGVPKPDTWVEVVGRPSSPGGGAATVTVDRIRRITPPRDPYE